MPITLIFTHSLGTGLWLEGRLLNPQKKRVLWNDLQVFPECWTVYERRCWKQYLKEASDDLDDNNHVYHHLKEAITQCKSRIRVDNQVKVVEKCHYNIKDLSEICTKSGLQTPLLEGGRETEGHSDDVPDLLISRIFLHHSQPDGRLNNWGMSPKFLQEFWDKNHARWMNPERV